MHRERLLEALLRRFARARDADAYALRGGMAIRSWIPGRVARDIDLVCRLPYRLRDLRARFTELLAPGDDLQFGELHISPYVGSPRPGLQLFARSNLGDVTADVTFELDVWPAAHRQGDVWTCPPEMIIATKTRVIGELGRRWRTKDLADIWHLLRRFPPETRVLGEAMERFGGRPLAGTWWNQSDAATKWAGFVAKHPAMPIELGRVVGEVRAQLQPVARQS